MFTSLDLLLSVTGKRSLCYEKFGRYPPGFCIALLVAYLARSIELNELQQFVF
jgi:hypothetical protein